MWILSSLGLRVWLRWFGHVKRDWVSACRNVVVAVVRIFSFTSSPTRETRASHLKLRIRNAALIIIIINRVFFCESPQGSFTLSIIELLFK